MFFIRLAFDQHFEFPADKTFGYRHGHLVLRGHRQFSAFLLHFVGNLASHGPGARAVFLGISKYPEPFESRLANEIQQGVKTCLSFTGKSDNEGGAQRDAGYAGADALN